ncbi:MAG: transporter substrate-binding domain-containing protein [Spirochaetaceae bacterium]|nr:transporter substrate-binding domain-containing protein [Spirochaetaceae bacterium]
MKSFCFFFFLLAATSLFAGGNRETADEAQMGRSASMIRRAGVIRVGVHFDMPKMGVFDSNTNRFDGFEIEIARLLARDLLGNENKVEFVPVRNERREDFLDRGTVDVIIATFGKTDQRAENYNISSPYYTDFVGLMARKDSGFQGLADLSGRSIGVVGGTSTRQAIDAAATAIGAHPYFYEFARFSEIKAALASGLLDVFASDRTVLVRYVDDTVTILPDHFAPREYGIATKLSNNDLATYVEQRIQQWSREGILDALKDHFGL